MKALIYLAEKRFGEENEVFILPYEIDLEAAYIKLLSMGIEIDELTEEQIKYLTAYSEGT